MYLYKDNFLTESTFKMFNEEMLNSYKPRPEGWWTKHGQLGYESYGKGLSGENFNEDAPELVLGENYPEENNYVRSAMLMGSKSLPDVVRSIKKHMIEDLKFTNPLARMMWFQYHSNKHKTYIFKFSSECATNFFTNYDVNLSQFCHQAHCIFEINALKIYTYILL